MAIWLISARCRSTYGRCRHVEREVYRHAQGVGIEKDEDRNVEAGSKYLRYLMDTYINEPGLNERDRQLLAFVAYNAGPGNLNKFRQKAKEMGLDQNVWFGNVENSAASIVGRETVQYVSNIYKYYVAYTMLVERLKENADAVNTGTKGG